MSTETTETAEISAKQATIEKYRTHENDVGSPEVQIALLTQRVESLSAHAKRHPQDIHSRRGLHAIVSQRKGLLSYLKREDLGRYKKIVAALGLRK